ncbi:MAG TPA: alpha-galactosidase [Treponema sp.]|nr:MAG: alpha-galactosidase [Treponema sp. GWC1_61_84]HCM28486.1 alpha-galactosidase [Treponema sp.]
MDIKFEENGIRVWILVTEAGDVRLLHCGSGDFPIPPDDPAAKFRLVEIHESGMNQADHHGSKHTGTSPGYLLRYRNHRFEQNGHGRLLELVQEYEGLFVTSRFQFYDGVSVIRSWTELENRGKSERPIEYLSSFALTGLTRGSRQRRNEGAFIHIPHSTWYGEAQWKKYRPGELGYDVVNSFSVKRISLSSTGTWPASEHLPMGAFEHEELGTTVAWQIETNASWHWELSDIAGEFYLQLSGPSYQEHSFLRVLKAGESFVSEPCALAFVRGGFEDGIRELTRYRRRIRRPNADNKNPAAIFNDYMNCLWGQPTTGKLLPLIDAAEAAGCKYFCIDAGWYADGAWWDGVGEWLPSAARFPRGIGESLERIRKGGMIAGLWLELEVMGIRCPLASQVGDDWFFMRNGRRVVDEGRYQLDYRNPAVRAHADGVIRRLVEEYGVGYIKMDYNINGGPGTERDADSSGSGLLDHTRAYLDWIDRVFARYPDLVIENCSSGGMRMEYAQLSRHSIQSVTDQTDYLAMSAIAANCATAVTPEQAAIWSYPLGDGDEEETIFNMVNALLLRVHQSGHLAELSAERFALVREGIDYHHAISRALAEALPFWPLGMASLVSPWRSFGMESNGVRYLAVWRTVGGEDEVPLPLRGTAGKGFGARCAYPASRSPAFSWNADEGILKVRLEEKTARIFEIR